jgi:hypothetical protein
LIDKAKKMPLKIALIQSVERLIVLIDFDVIKTQALTEKLVHTVIKDPENHLDGTNNGFRIRVV